MQQNICIFKIEDCIKKKMKNSTITYVHIDVIIFFYSRFLRGSKAKAKSSIHT